MNRLVVSACTLCLWAFAAGPVIIGLFLADGAVEAAREQFEVNLIGPLRMARAFAPILAKNGGGAISNVLSVASWMNGPGYPGGSSLRRSRPAAGAYPAPPPAQHGARRREPPWRVFYCRSFYRRSVRRYTVTAPPDRVRFTM